MASTTNSCISNGDGCRSATNFPQFIDTESCLCGFLDSREASRNGNTRQLWRCIGDANQDVANGDHGKWFESSLPSEELSGINQPQNWGQNPPDLQHVYVLVGDNGEKKYEVLHGNDSPQLVDNDKSCTGKNSTQLSTKYYANSNRDAHGGSSSSSASSHATSSHSPASSSSTVTSSISSTSAPSAAATPSVSSTSTSPTAGSSSASASSGSSDASFLSFKSTLLLGMLVIPTLAGFLRV